MIATLRQILVKLYNSLKLQKNFKVFITFAITTWIAHFFYFRDFGLYEDDYVFISDAMGENASYLLERLQYFILWPQGRPVGFYLASLFSFVGYKIGGLAFLYLIGFVIATVNSYLFYKILKRTGLNILALMGGLSFCLFPADTTKSFLTHAFILQTSLTFLLVATIYYLSGKKHISYIISLGSLLSYESAFIVFFGIPLLKNKWNKKMLIDMIKHTLISSFILVFVAFIRTLTGESRVLKANSEWFLIPGKIFYSISIGSSTSMSLFFKTPLYSIIFEWNKTTWIVFFITIVFFTKVFWDYRFYYEKEHSNYSLVRQNNIFYINKDYRKKVFYLKTLKILFTGLVLLCLSYPLSFSDPHYPPTTEYGRFTSEHLAATFGGSIIFASLSSLLFYITKKGGKKKYIIILACYLSVIVGYHFTIQRDFKKSWKNQREFWTQVISACPDIDKRTVVLVVNSQLPETKYILTHSWADPIVLEQIYHLPNKRNPVDFAENPWDEYARPALFLIDKYWKKELINGEEIWKVTNLTWFYLGVGNLAESKVIVLEMDNNELTRIDDNVTQSLEKWEWQNKKYYLGNTLKKREFFKYLIDENKL
jgi:hypothetical protein